MNNIKCLNCNKDWDSNYIKESIYKETEAGSIITFNKTNKECFERSATALTLKNYPWVSSYKGEQWKEELTNFWNKQFYEIGWEFKDNNLYSILDRAGMIIEE
jgi:molybdopterin synthase catalytic subunit